MIAVDTLAATVLRCIRTATLDTADKATTFFSGPSATADIEMTLIKDVHGPALWMSC